MQRSVLMIEDDPDAKSIANHFFRSAGFKFLHAPDGLTGLRLVDESSPDLVILDLSLPDVDGTEICRRIRLSSDTPIVMLTGRDAPAQKVLGFDFGADDYITKPFSPQELVARIRAILRRAKPDPLSDDDGRTLSVAGIDVEVSRHSVKVGGEPVHLTATELRLLILLMKDAGRIVSREEMARVIHRDSYDRDLRTVDSHVSHLRTKLGRHADKRLIQSIYGRGYRLNAR